jgi:hypothetical protein
MKYVIVPISHGVEDRAIPDNYADPLINNIRDFMTDEERGYFQPCPVNWSGKVHAAALEAFNDCEKGLGHQTLRRLKYTLGASVIMYQRTRGNKGFFDEVHELIDSAVKTRLASYPNGSAICGIGHSLGSQVMYNHFWETHLDQKPRGLFIMGSPFALYSTPYADEGWGNLPTYPIDFLWNFVHEDDWIGSNLELVHPSKNIDAFVEDFQVPVNWLNPKNWLYKLRILGGLEAHIQYWKNKFVAEKIAGKLKEIIHS